MILIDTGKKTWRYQIAIDDVIRYLQQRVKWGSMIPPGAVSSRQANIIKHRSSLSMKRGSEKDVYRYFEQLYKDAGDVLTLPEIIILTGLSQRTVLLMLKEKEIKSLGSSPRYIVPKQYLLDFVSSRRYIDIKSNTDAFHKIVGGFDKWKATGCIDYDPAKYFFQK